VHATLLEVELYVPAMQSWQAVWPTADWNVPAAQLVHSVAPGESENLPPAHAEHVSVPATLANVPAVQAEHEASPEAALLPAAHGTHDERKAPELGTWPALQLRHAVRPDVEYW